jgi:hypothetical protein
MESDPAAGEEQVFLMGRPPVREFLEFVRAQAVDPSTVDLGALTAEWRAANDRVRQLEESERGISDGVEVRPIPDDLTEMAANVSSDPVVRKAFETLPWQIGVVDLDSLVVYQKRIGLPYVARVRGVLGDSPTPSAIFRLCLPVGTDVSAPPAQVLSASNGWLFISPSNDLRVLDGQALPPAAVRGRQLGGYAAGVVSVFVGFSVNLLHLARIEGRLMLLNGSHRAYALREAGVREAPALVLDVTRREELELLGVAELNERTDVYLKDPRPPVLKDYFDSQLRKIVIGRRSRTQVTLAFTGGPSLIPD